MSVHYRACNLCEASCGLEITVEANRVVDIRGDAAGRRHRNAIKGDSIGMQAGGLRLRHPTVNGGGLEFRLGSKSARAIAFEPEG
ncbi:MAG: hypothetical protein FJW80_11205 [Actinobacteria bacterium]|nr:hypothetical protein [Actinomycetota bacterium]